MGPPFGALGATGAAADSPTDGCVTENRSPNGNDGHGLQLFSVAELLALGYSAPALVDDPANGGNGDGFICGIPLGNQTTPRGTQLYLWGDNQYGPVPG